MVYWLRYEDILPRKYAVKIGQGAVNSPLVVGSADLRWEELCFEQDCETIRNHYCT